ncbi:MAG: PSD1 domain-containing protein [Bryobacterales bacterium]|nr:PSD1 domain-containing protein [Bryobacterales bacterium]
MQALFLLGLLSAYAHAQTIDFNREIRPILSDRCFTCHGPDAAERKANLRLDLESDAKRKAILPGNATSSPLYQRITATNALRMPPAYAGHKKLADREIALIERWIREGAKWQSHWAFTSPQKPAIPTTRNTAWPRNNIDRFLLARLEKEGLAPSPEASKETLIRRLSLDITGLPPTPAELAAFLADKSPAAYENLVDRLFASPHYGERMAVDWLDAARYADTHGYQVDPEKEMWAWRDWVVNAFNRNQTFDQFTIDQMAGDLLPNPTLDQRIATGFHRNHRVNTEAGSIAAEFHVENIVDRISTVGTVWLGLTVGCSRCHDHKFDPLTMRDFYSLFAFFNNVPEVGTGGPRDGRGNLQPVMKLPAPELEAQLAAVQYKLTAARSELKSIETRLAPAQTAWESKALAHQPRWHTLEARDLKSREGVLFEKQNDGSYFASGPKPDRDVITVTAQTHLRDITAFRLELIPDPRLPAGGSGRGPNGRAVITLFEAQQARLAEPSKLRPLDLATATASYASPESVLIRVLRPMQQLTRGWSVEPELDKPHSLVLEPRQLTGYAGGTAFTFKIGNEYGAAHLLGRFRLSVTDDPYPDFPSEDVTAALRTAPAARTPEEQTLLRRYYLQRQPERRVINDTITRLNTQRTAIENKIPSTMIMKEMGVPRDTFVLTRGAYEKRAEKVTAATPAFLPPLPTDAPKNRLGLAQWLVSPSNPLTARVMVNRLWQMYFGNGLVRTAEDFGSQGIPPTHPELLDYLATEFVRSGWDRKALQKQIVMSAAYRQSAKATPELLEKDPENLLLARGARFRLPAETIRDQALAVAGLLQPKMGGPPVKPYQPDGLWEQLSVIDDRKLYIRSTGDDLWRRSLYTYWKRTVPPPSMTTFDAPTREFCVVKRTRSSTPLQALALLNDETYVEAARVLAQRMLREGGPTPSARIAHGFRLATSRTPSTAEIAVLSAGLERRLAAYKQDSAAVTQLLAAGEAPRDASLPQPELAAYTTLAAVILNLDEVVTRQ